MKILRFPNPKLKQISKPMTEEEVRDPSFKETVEELEKMMYDTVAYGIAAPQVGIQKRFIVVDVDWIETEEKEAQVIINPEIAESDGSILSKGEMCLSVPMLSVDVIRKAEIVLKGFDKDWNPITLSCDGLESCVLQHEIDHLDGVLITDHIGKFQRDLYRTRLRKKKLKDVMKVWRPDRND